MVINYNEISINGFNYYLPNERIAKYPMAARDLSKLLVFKDNIISEAKFAKIGNCLPQGANIYFNNTRVIHARLKFIKPTGSPVEIFCLSPETPVEYQTSLSQTHTCAWKCMVGNLKKWKAGNLELKTTIDKLDIILRAEKIRADRDSVIIGFSWNGGFSFGKLLDHFGNMPIPPYLDREPENIDKDRYQTVFSRYDGSVAAPTAGLHFTPEIISGFGERSIGIHEITLHVGAGTFQPVKAENAMDHPMHCEAFSISIKTIENLINTHGANIATGTTTLRTLESLYWLALKSVCQGKIIFNLGQWDYNGYTSDKLPKATELLKDFRQLMIKENLKVFSAKTAIMIVPGYPFQMVDALITNFHQPKSTLLLLVAAFAGPLWKDIYSYALENNFRFLSYGDSSILWRK